MEAQVAEFLVEDLLDLTNGDDVVMADTSFLGSINMKSLTASSATAAAVDSCNSSHSSGDNTRYLASAGECPVTANLDAQFSGSEICVPYDDLAELEWLSNFVEESFSTEDLYKFQLIPGPTNGPAQFLHHQSATTRPSLSPTFKTETTVRGKARSKLSRVAPSDWSTRLLVVPSSPSPLSPADSHVAYAPSSKKSSKGRETAAENPDGEVRRCLHCASEKTPQWRTGPMGPKTLCNACGVRYKSGRLVPEYRPAASPTFLSTKHSNSHRKVLELRRQKELQLQRHHLHRVQLMCQNGGILGVSNGDGYLDPSWFRHGL